MYYSVTLISLLFNFPSDSILVTMMALPSIVSKGVTFYL